MSKLGVDRRPFCVRCGNRYLPINPGDPHFDCPKADKAKLLDDRLEVGKKVLSELPFTVRQLNAFASADLLTVGQVVDAYFAGQLPLSDRHASHALLIIVHSLELERELMRSKR